MLLVHHFNKKHTLAVIGLQLPHGHLREERVLIHDQFLLSVVFVFVCLLCGPTMPMKFH